MWSLISLWQFALRIDGHLEAYFRNSLMWSVIGNLHWWLSGTWGVLQAPFRNFAMWWDQSLACGWFTLEPRSIKLLHKNALCCFKCVCESEIHDLWIFPGMHWCCHKNTIYYNIGKLRVVILVILCIHTGFSTEENILEQALHFLFPLWFDTLQCYWNYCHMWGGGKCCQNYLKSDSESDMKYKQQVGFVSFKRCMLKLEHLPKF